MKILLINPPCPNIIRESLPPIVEDSTGVYPPLGLLYIAAYAESVPDCEVKIIDCQAQDIGHDQIGKLAAAYSPDVVGIQAMTFTLIDAAMVADAVKLHMPESMIVFGGPHPTLYPAESLSLKGVDVVVVGEGEHPFRELIISIQNGKPIDSIEGVFTKNGAEQTFSHKLQYIKDLDTLKTPARHLLDMSLYQSPLASHDRITTMMSSRGCPGRCTFCDRPQMGKVFRKRSAKNVVDEMVDCYKHYDIREFTFYDDTFTIDKKRVIDVCNLLNEKKLDVRWDIRARIDTMTPEMIARLRRAGCMRIHYGVETGSPRLQKLVKKHLDLNRVKDVFEATKKEGIETLGYFMIGLPSETREEMERTFQLMTTLPMDYAISPYLPLIPARKYIGTPLSRVIITKITGKRLP